MSEASSSPRGTLNVAEINPYAPRPFTFTEAALCLRDSLRAAGLASTIHTNETDLHRHCIVLGALPPHLPAVEQLNPAKAVIYNLEQLAAAPPVIGDKYVPWLRRWQVADYHSHNLDWLHRHSGGLQRAVELPLVPTASLAFRPDLPYEPTVDVVFFGTLNERRQRLIEALRAEGITVEVVEGAFAEELAPALKRARLVLHVHFYPTGLFPIARVLQPVMQGVPIVCEASVFATLSDWSRSGIVFAPYDQLVTACRALLASPEERQERALRNRDFAAAIDFATPLQRLLQALVVPAQPVPPPPTPVPPPVATPAPHAPAPVAGTGHRLSNEEIEAILASEAEQLPPEAHLPAPAFRMAERQPGDGRQGWWLAGLLILSGLYGLWTMLR